MLRRGQESLEAINDELAALRKKVTSSPAAPPTSASTFQQQTSASSAAATATDNPNSRGTLLFHGHFDPTSFVAAKKSAAAAAADSQDVMHYMRRAKRDFLRDAETIDEYRYSESEEAESKREEAIQAQLRSSGVAVQVLPSARQDILGVRDATPDVGGAPTTSTNPARRQTTPPPQNARTSAALSVIPSPPPPSSSTGTTNPLRGNTGNNNNNSASRRVSSSMVSSEFDKLYELPKQLSRSKVLSPPAAATPPTPSASSKHQQQQQQQRVGKPANPFCSAISPNVVASSGSSSISGTTGEGVGRRESLSTTGIVVAHSSVNVQSAIHSAQRREAANSTTRTSRATTSSGTGDGEDVATPPAERPTYVTTTIVNDGRVAFCPSCHRVVVVVAGGETCSHCNAALRPAVVDGTSGGQDGGDAQEEQLEIERREAAEFKAAVEEWRRGRADPAEATATDETNDETPDRLAVALQSLRVAKTYFTHLWSELNAQPQL